MAEPELFRGPRDRRRATFGVTAAVVLALIAEIPVTAVRAVAGIVLCVVIGWAGAAIAAALTPTSPVQRFGAALTATTVALMITGFFLSLTRIGIGRVAVPICLGVIAVALFLVPLRVTRRTGEEEPDEPFRLGTENAITIGLGVLLLAAAVVVSVVSYHSWEAGSHFSALSARSAANGSITVWVRNHEGTAERYRLVVAPPTGDAVDRTLSVADGSQRRLTIGGSLEAPARVSLYRASSPRQAVASVLVQSGT